VKLSTRSLYGLRLLHRLTQHYNQGPLQLREVSEKEGISEKYLGQIVLLLRAGGILTSVRGNQGGYLLASRPSEITVLQVVELLEADFLGHVTVDQSADTTSFQATMEVWKRLGDAIRQILGSVTLLDLVEWPQLREPILDYSI